MFRFKLLLGLAALAAAPVLDAQVRVVESAPLERSGEQAQNSNATASNMQAELFYQVQSLQQEVLELRGMVEEQAHEIKRLKQQRMDDYLDLDRRIGRLSGSGSQNPAGGSAVSGNSGRSGDVNLASDLDSLSETETYRAAYQLLRERNLEEAISAFNAYLAEYPRGNYAGNSYYWLGEIYLLKADLEQARDWFSKLLQDFPDDRKVSDAKFKLGKVHHDLGNDAKARELLQEVAGDGSDAARLARRYLEENFQ